LADLRGNAAWQHVLVARQSPPFPVGFPEVPVLSLLRAVALAAPAPAPCQAAILGLPHDVFVATLGAAAVVLAAVVAGACSLIVARQKRRTAKLVVAHQQALATIESFGLLEDFIATQAAPLFGLTPEGAKRRFRREAADCGFVTPGEFAQPSRLRARQDRLARVAADLGVSS
jgi:hypothetical protein